MGGVTDVPQIYPDNRHMPTDDTAWSATAEFESARDGGVSQ
jgi:hypothetical protein